MDSLVASSKFSVESLQKFSVESLQGLSYPFLHRSAVAVQTNIHAPLNSDDAVEQFERLFEIQERARAVKSLNETNINGFTQSDITIAPEATMAGAVGEYASANQAIAFPSGSSSGDRITGFAGVWPEAVGHHLDRLLKRIYGGQEDNSLRSARDIGTLSGSQSFQDVVGAIDNDDYYRFTLSQNSDFTLALTGLLSDAEVQLLDSKGQLIEGSYGEGSLSESIEQRLDAGQYYIRVYPHGGSTNYELTVSAVAIAPTDRAGNTPSTARNVGVLTGQRTFQDQVNLQDSNDYYRFDLSQNSNFSLSLAKLSADADVELLHSSGQVIARSGRPGTSSEGISGELLAGSYYVRVYSFLDADTNYQLNLSATAITAGFSSTYGYGLVNAASAVAKAAGQSEPFDDVANLPGVTNWGLNAVKAPEAWNNGHTGEGVIVAVIDSGIDIHHEDLRDNIWVNSGEIPDNGIDDDGNGYIDDVNGWNFGRNQNNNNVLPGTNEPGQGHGTHVAGTIAASNNGLGMTGVAYDAKIMAIRMGDIQDSSFTNGGTLAQAIRYAVDNGANVINMSLGWSDSPALKEALAYAASRNVITVSAAGNGDGRGNGLPSPGNPAQYATRYGISVGAIDPTGRLARFSNRAGSNSEMHHVVAPGINVYSTEPGDRYGFQNGTSMAAPHVAGVIALMRSANPDLTHAQVRQILIGSTTQLS